MTKPQFRVLGIDDAPFSLRDPQTEIVGVVVRAPGYVEGVLMDHVAVDGRDASERLAAMIGRSRFRDNLALILLDGAAVGGFNIVDLGELYEDTGIPVATVTGKEPDAGAMEKAIRSRFEDAEERLSVLRRHKLNKVWASHKPLYVSCIGMEVRDLADAIARCTIRGSVPEPLRIAHLVATAVKKGESRGQS